MIPTIEMISATEMTPNHHRNDTGGHHWNDPRNIGNGIKRTTKTGQQYSTCFLFIYIASFLRCVIYFYHTLFCSKLLTSVTGSHYYTCFPISFGTCTSCCSCHLKSLTSWKLFCYSKLFFCSWLPLLSKQVDQEKSKRGMFFYAFHWYIVRHHFARVIILIMCAKIVFGVRYDLTQSRFIT